MRIGIIGTGFRSTVFTETCIDRNDDTVQISALCDIDGDKARRYADTYFKTNKPNIYTDYRELLVDETIDSVIISSFDSTHKEIAIEAMRHGKHILLEKPIATTVDDCLAIWRESEKHNKVVLLGFGLRYMSAYVETKSLIDSGRIGKVISVEAKEILGHLHAGSFFRRWHRYKVNNGGFLNAKCSHDMDMLNWLINEKPLYVNAFGSRSYFNEIIGASKTCTDCKLAHECRYCYNEKDYGPFSPVQNMCVFNNEKDIVDHEVVSILYDKGITANFTVSMLSSKANRTLVVFGTEATIYTDFAEGTVRVEDIAGVSKVMYQFEDLKLPHGGADPKMFGYFVKCVQNNIPHNDAKAGAMSTAIALAAEESMENKCTVDFQKFINR